MSPDDIPDGFMMSEVGLLPEDWQVLSLGEVAESLIGGGTPPTKVHEYWGGDIPWITSKSIVGFRIRAGEKCITEKAVIESSTQVVPRNNLLIGTRVGVGKTAVSDIDIAINQDLTGVIIDCGKHSVEFLVYQMNHPRIQRAMSERTRGTTIKGVPREDLKGILLAIPPLSEQKTISHALSSVQSAKEKTEATISALKELKKSIMKHLFTYGPVPVTKTDEAELKDTFVGLVPESWETSRIGEIAEVNHESRNPSLNPDRHFTYIDIASIDSQTGRIIAPKKMTGREAPSRARRVMHNGDVIMSTVRPYLKGYALVGEDHDGDICSTGFAVLTPRPETCSSYLFYSLHSDAVQRQFSANMSGASYPALNEELVAATVVPRPPSHVQQEIGRIMTSIDEAVLRTHQCQHYLSTLFQALLNNLMTGKLRVTNLEAPI